MTIKHILGIETSCDETAASVISYNSEKKEICVQSHVVKSQTESHAPFGGVVPEVAARDHLLNIDTVVKTALKNSNLQITDIDQIGVTLGPGLIGALMVGVLYARGIVCTHNIPLIGVNHVRAHLAPCFFLSNTFRLNTDEQKWHKIPHINFPTLGLTVSGGHCHLSYIKSPLEHIILGRTLDDACGEAFDKVAKLLGLGYPGGPALEILAQSANIESAKHISYTQPFSSKDSKENRYNFSYSGLKTASLLHIKSGIHAYQDIAYSFQEAALSQLKSRVINALNDFQEINTLLIAGGVAQNQRFREIFSDLRCKIIFAPSQICSDNATMIALQTILDKNVDATIHHPFSRYSY